jgi:GPN-loop GTPase
VGQDDYVLFDCPGQIEIYADQDIFKDFVKFLQNYGKCCLIVGFSLISMYMMDVNFIFERSKFLSGMLQALSIQITLELPAMTVLTKCDLIQ